MNLKNKKRIVILGDSGRGKSTLAEKISKNLNLKLYSSDDLIWQTKFTKQREKVDSKKMADKIALEDSWVFEGSSLRLHKSFLEKADLIIYLEHKSFCVQSFVLFKRFLERKHETLGNHIDLLKHNAYGRYGLGYKKGKIKDLDFLDQNEIKYRKLSSFKEIDEFVKGLR